MVVEILRLLSSLYELWVLVWLVILWRISKKRRLLRGLLKTDATTLRFTKERFEQSVAHVKESLVRNTDETVDLTTQQQPPTSGLYQAQIHEYGITGRKREDKVYHEGSDSSAILSVQFLPSEEGGNLIMRGSRVNTSTNFYAIEQGLLLLVKPTETIGAARNLPNCYSRTAGQLLVVRKWFERERILAAILLAALVLLVVQLLLGGELHRGGGASETLDTFALFENRFWT